MTDEVYRYREQRDEGRPIDNAKLERLQAAKLERLRAAIRKLRDEWKTKIETMMNPSATPHVFGFLTGLASASDDVADLMREHGIDWEVKQP